MSTFYSFIRLCTGFMSIVKSQGETTDTTTILRSQRKKSDSKLNFKFHIPSI